MPRDIKTMTTVEARLFPRVGCGYVNLMPLLIYLFNAYSPENTMKALKYLIKNNIVGPNLINVLRSDFNDDFDKLIKFAIKSNPERRFKL